MNIDVSKNTKGGDLSKLRKLIKYCLEVRDRDFHFDSSYYTIHVESINWASHVTEDKCRLFAKYATMLDFVENISISLYYLSEPDFDLYVSKNSEEYEDQVRELLKYTDEDEKDVAEEFVKEFPKLKAEILTHAIKGFTQK
jgi:hypothetical protein